jgi:prepilin-type N-terminal cleavage/methylation domain-containing protein
MGRKETNAAWTKDRDRTHDGSHKPLDYSNLNAFVSASRNLALQLLTKMGVRWKVSIEGPMTESQIMRSMQRNSSPRGFTIFELLIVMALMGIMATLFAPNFLRLVHRAKLTGTAQKMEVVMRTARQNAIRYNAQAVVRINQATEEVIAFVDVDGVNIGDPPDGIFNPIAGQPHRATDWEFSRMTLPNSVNFDVPAADPDGGTVVFGFANTQMPVPVPDVAIFLPDGSAESAGAFRIGDLFNNFLEVRVAPRLTARVSTRKFSDADNAWHVRNETGKPWKWN